jgi:alanine dehydrogenase
MSYVAVMIGDPFVGDERIVIENVIDVDDCEQASHNGELVHAIEAGALARDQVTQLGDVLAGAASGRGSNEEITTFDSTGLAIQDLAIALAAMERASALDLRTVEL